MEKPALYATPYELQTRQHAHQLTQWKFGEQEFLDPPQLHKQLVFAAVIQKLIPTQTTLNG